MVRSTDLHKFISELPNELMLIIRRLTYKPKEPILLQDISHFFKSKSLALTLYHEKYKHTYEQEPKARDNWFINDIECYCNDYRALMHGFLDRYYNILSRSIVFDTKDKIIHYIGNTYNKNYSLETVINIYWGLLKPKERIQVLCNSDHSETDIIDTYNRLFETNYTKLIELY